MGNQFILSTEELPGRSLSAPKIIITAKSAPTNPPPLNYQRLCRLIKQAISGSGTKEEAVFQALQELNQNQAAINELKKVYHQQYGVGLIDDIEDDFGGDELEFALQLINNGSAGSDQQIESTPVNYSKAASRIRDAMEGMGTEEEVVYAVLIPFRRNPNALQALRDAYQNLYSENLTERIFSEFSGEELDYVLFLFFDVKEAYVYYLKEAAKNMSAGVKGGRAVGDAVWENENAKYDRSFWEAGNPLDENGKTMVPGLKLRQGKDPSAAIEAMYNSMCTIAPLNYLFGTWRVDCAEWVQVHHLYAMWKTLGPYRLDERFSNKEFWFRNHRSSGLKAKAIYSRLSVNDLLKPLLLKNGEPQDSPSGIQVLFDESLPSKDVDTIFNEAPVGSRVGFFNQAIIDPLIGQKKPTPEEAGWANENSMKIGPDLFSAHGGTWATILTSQEIKKLSLKSGHNPTLSDEDNIRKTVFIGEVELYTTIADDPWNEWAFVTTSS